ncbi:hypothetical protein Pcinc_003670 [Petrolisthes cinctipes]|uniref:Ig-like domain-containing protein n=1 Tax=Petrolisthes cinctipes TaxID=88211 RepID=A0AAE1GHA1_PETCI|nr:hypothetical protein Pcinc_003670 [Petrolisthes cinctipes]
MENADSDVASCLEADLAMSEEDESPIEDHWPELPSRNPTPSPRSLRSSGCSLPPPQPLPSDPLMPRLTPCRIPMVWTVCLRLPRLPRVLQLCMTYLLCLNMVFLPCIPTPCPRPTFLLLPQEMPMSSSPSLGTYLQTQTCVGCLMSTGPSSCSVNWLK